MVGRSLVKVVHPSPAREFHRMSDPVPQFLVVGSGAEARRIAYLDEKTGTSHENRAFSGCPD